jgi:hypothetical protein
MPIFTFGHASRNGWAPSATARWSPSQTARVSGRASGSNDQKPPRVRSQLSLRRRALIQTPPGAL